MIDRAHDGIPFKVGAEVFHLDLHCIPVPGKTIAAQQALLARRDNPSFHERNAGTKEWHAPEKGSTKVLTLYLCYGMKESATGALHLEKE